MPVLILKMSEKEAAEIMEAIEQNGTIHPGNDVCLSCNHIDPEACETCAGGTTLDDNTLIPMTNGDCIRAMTDEELAAYMVNDPTGVFCDDHTKCHGRYEAGKAIQEDICAKCALEWLRKPAGEVQRCG